MQRQKENHMQDEEGFFHSHKLSHGLSQLGVFIEQYPSDRCHIQTVIGKQVYSRFFPV